MIDMETGLRGFLVAGKPVFPEPYHGGKSVFNCTMAIATSHVSDNPAQVDRLSKIYTLKNDWLAEHATTAIELRKNVGVVSEQASNDKPVTTMDDVAGFIGRGLGKKSMDELRGVVAAFVDEEHKLIGERAAQADSVSLATKITAVVGALIALLGSIVIVVLINRNISQQLGTEPGTSSTLQRQLPRGI